MSWGASSTNHCAEILKFRLIWKRNSVTSYPNCRETVRSIGWGTAVFSQGDLVQCTRNFVCPVLFFVNWQRKANWMVYRKHPGKSSFLSITQDGHTLVLLWLASPLLSSSNTVTCYHAAFSYRLFLVCTVHFHCALWFFGSFLLPLFLLYLKWKLLKPISVFGHIFHWKSGSEHHVCLFAFFSWKVEGKRERRNRKSL